jgi:hypothetical protein
MQESVIELLIEANELHNNWARKRTDTVKLFRDLVDDIRARTVLRDVATVGGASLAVAGAAAAVIVSGGTALIPIAAAAVGPTYAGVGAFGGTVVLGSELLYNVVNAEAVKLLHKAIVKDKQESAKLWEVLQKIEANINGVEVPTVRFVINLGDFRYNRYDLSQSANQVAVANNALQALDDFDRFSYVASIGLSSISLLFNDMTLRKTLATVRKGEVLRVASDLRRQAGRLEDELPVYKKKVQLLKRRVHEKELELQRRTKEKEKELELLKRRVERSFYMALAFFVCCIGIIIYFLCYRL